MTTVNYAKITTYVDELGRQITVFSPQGTCTINVDIPGKGLKAATIFKGVAMVPMKKQGSDKIEYGPFEFSFPLTTKSIQEAFDTFEEVKAKAIEVEQKKTMEQSRIIAARTMPRILAQITLWVEVQPHDWCGEWTPRIVAAAEVPSSRRAG